MYEIALFGTSFNGDISKWDTSKVEKMVCMIQEAISFNGDISKWDTSDISINNIYKKQKSNYVGK